MAIKKNGERCGNAALLGSVVCRYHGGSAPQVMKKARERLGMMRDWVIVEIARIAASGDDERTRLAALKDLADRAGLAPAQLVNIEQHTRWEGFEESTVVHISREDIPAPTEPEIIEGEWSEASELPYVRRPSEEDCDPVPSPDLGELPAPPQPPGPPITNGDRALWGKGGPAPGRDGTKVPAGREAAIARHLGVETVGEVVYRQGDGTVVDSAGEPVDLDPGTVARDAAREAGVEIIDPYAQPPGGGYGPHGGL